MGASRARRERRAEKREEASKRDIEAVLDYRLDTNRYFIQIGKRSAEVIEVTRLKLEMAIGRKLGIGERSGVRNNSKGERVYYEIVPADNQ